MHKIINKISRNYYDFGILRTFHLGMLYLIKVFYEKHLHIIYRINTSTALSIENTNKTFQYRFISEHDLDAIRQIEHMEESFSGRMIDFLSRQHICLCAFDNEKVIGFILAAVGKFVIPMTDGITTSGKRSAYMDQITVRKEYRTRSIATSMQLYLLEELRRRRIKRLYARVYPYNAVAIRAAKKMGAVFIIKVHYISIFGKKRYRCEKMGKTRGLNAFQARSEST